MLIKTLNLFLLAFLLMLSSCSSKVIHPELKEDSNLMRRLWTYSTHQAMSEAGERGFDYANAVSFENTLIFGSQSSGIISIYPDLQRKRWEFLIHGGVVSELLVDQNSVYFCAGDGFLYSISAETGKKNWSYDLHNPLASRPSVSQGRLFVTTTDDTVYAFDAGTGKWLWHYKRRSAANTTIRSASTPAVDNQVVYVGTSDGYLVALSLEEGHLLWEKKIHAGGKFTDVDAKPVIDGSTLYVPSYDGALYALNKTKGETLWRFDAGGAKSVQLLDDQKLILPSSDGTLYAIQRNNGKQIWKFELDRGAPTQISLLGSYLAVGSTHQYLYLIDQLSGVARYRFNSGYGSGFAGTPYYDTHTKRLYVLSFAGNLYAFQFLK